MRRIGAVVILLGAALAVAVVGGPAPATAVPNVVVANGSRFLPPEVRVVQGTGLTFVNTDGVPHDVTAVERGSNGQPLFKSATIVTGTSPVAGVEALAPNTYSFFCTVHTEMRGLLTVVGAAVAPPPVPAPPPTAVALGVSVPTPTSIAFSSSGDALLVASYSLGTIFRLPLLPAGLLGPAVEFATGFDSPLGVVQAPDGTVFVSDSTPSTRPGRTRDGRVWAMPPSGGAASTAGRLVVSELPNGRHNTNNLAVLGHRLYITNGSSTDDGTPFGAEEPLSGALLSVRLSARGLTPSTAPIGSLVVEGKGMRNPYDVAFRPGTNEAWLATNGSDMLDPYGEDLLMRTTVSPTPPPTWPTTDFGFPGCVYRAGPNGEPEVGDNAAAYRWYPCDPNHKKPEQALGLHVSADGLAFGPGPEGSFWGNDLFVAEFGSFNGTQGHKIVRVPVGPRGVTGRPVDFFVGGTPLDLAFGPGGLYVADFGTGQITLLRPPSF
ncbi:MAG: hypothetical protein QOF60_105 [Actinomycetota bacterium]|jgi:glucose/arabinose dehydrogenase/plastocyanin|nr:hypothetical protein [Actinomycetota bacterium]